MSEIRTIRYDDGRWCEQEYENDKLHGRWTVFFANGQRDWERQYSNGRQEGYQRTWDEKGHLIEEQWYHLGALHGVWKRWDETGKVEVVGDFLGGFSREALEKSVNPDFNQSLKPHFGLEPTDCIKQIKTLLAGAVRQTARMKKVKRSSLDLSQPGSFWNHVNVAGVNEEWPCLNGEPLAPILQINCADVSLTDNPLSNFSFVTLFAIGSDVLQELGHDVVVRAYRRHDEIVRRQPPCDPIDVPSILAFSEGTACYPDENDLPPGLRVCLEDFEDEENILSPVEKLNSRIGGWPGWLQSCTISSFGRFAFQVDSLDVEGWECGDCTIHYFFLKHDGTGFSWCQEMC